jgi:hypothetical protein
MINKTILKSLAKCVMLLFVAGPWTLRAQTTNTPLRLDYSSFQIINERNIFNPHRSARSAPRERTSRSAKPKTTESFALVGTMNYSEKGPLAFFEGSSSDYRKVLKPHETIAGFTVAEIAQSHVKLASQTNQLELRVGMQLQHDENGSWQIGERSEIASASTSFSNSSNSSSRYSSRGTSYRRSDAGGSGRESSREAASTNGPVRGEVPMADALLPAESGDAPDPAVAPDPAQAPAGGDSILERLRRRAAAERGENPP